MDSPAVSLNPNEASAARTVKVRTDHHLWGTYILLVIIAVIELFSASIQEVTDANIFEPIMRHGVFILVGLFLMIILQKIHYRYIYGFIPLYVVGCVILMLWVAVAGVKINGAKRAVELAGFMLLPAEFLKLAAALGMAWILSRFQVKGKRDVSVAGMVTAILFLGLCCGLLFSHGLSNTIVVAAIGFSMMLVGGMGWKKFVIALGVFAVVGGAAFYIKTHAADKAEITEYQHQMAVLNHENADSVSGSGRGKVWNNRLAAHFRPNKHAEALSSEHQQEQYSYIAQARGGVKGVGIGRSRENARLPLAFSDYIYAIIIEEMGLFVGIGILICYIWILGRSAKLTMAFKQTLPGVLCMGCAFVIVFQALFHMAIVSGVFPVSGQPLPLISKGGTSVLTASMAFGIMLSVARHAVRNTDTKAEQTRELEILPENVQSANPAEVKTN